MHEALLQQIRDARLLEQQHVKGSLAQGSLVLSASEALQQAASLLRGHEKLLVKLAPSRVSVADVLRCVADTVEAAGATGGQAGLRTRHGL